MKKQISIFCSKYLFIPLVITLAGCGGGGSSNTVTESNDSALPVFQANAVLIAPSATPTGDITDTTPTFTWQIIQNATEYQYGHESYEANENNGWRSYTLLVEDLTCNVVENSCSHTPSDFTFTVGDKKAWWVRAKINGTWAEWSDPHIFAVIQNPPSIGIPNIITPIGEIIDTTPEFSWSAVQDSTEYQFVHEDTDSNSQEYLVTKEQAGCSVIDQACAFTPPDNTFEVGETIKWWVRAKVNDIWGEWSDISTFTVIPETANNVIPLQISPVGEISTASPTLSWTMIEGATEYTFGHQETGTAVNWQQYSTTPALASCQNSNDVCTYTLPENTFVDGEKISWWVRALVDGNLQGWSRGMRFIVANLEPQLGLKINEVLAANTRSGLDPDFSQFSDWIELHNTTTESIDISGFGLSDDEDDPLQWKFPAGTIIEANSYLLVWADGEDKVASALHTNFKLSSKGEDLTLADNNGTVIDRIDFGKQVSDVTTTTQLDSNVYMTPTPGIQNGVTYASKDLSEEASFNFESGFFDNSISLVLSQENAADIFFTTDGSTPNSNSQKYTQAINVNETTVIRAIAMEEGVLPSKIISNTYFINHSSNLPVVSLTIDPDYLFDPKIGIYTDGDGTNGVPLNECSVDFTEPFNYAQEWERPSHLEFFGNTLESEFTLTSGISISGQCSRQNQKKSFAFELDSKFGTKSLEFKLFDSKDVEEFYDFKLRTGSFGYELSDVIGAELTHTGNLNIDYQAYRATQMFVNGEYWGLYNFREKKGAEFITSNYPDIDKDELDIINQGFEAKRGDTDDYYALEILLVTTLGLDLSNDADYQTIIGMIDESNYIDYMSLMIYSANTDWIGSNQRSWKEKKEGAKWRWMIDDLDAGFHTNSVDLNQFSVITQSGSSDVMVSLFKALTKNPTFNQKFKSRFMTLLDTVYSPDNMLNRINTIVDERYDYIPLENPVWDTITTGSFDRHVQRLKDFANARNTIVKNQLNIFIPDVVTETTVN